MVSIIIESGEFMAKCTGCNGTILFGGITNRDGKYCNEECISTHCVSVADEIVPKAQMEKIVEDAHKMDCPKCKSPGPVDIHQATKITSYLIAYTVATDSIIACAKCGKGHKFKAGIHTLFLGIWSPKGLLHSLIYFPAGIIGGLTTSVSSGPSKKFTKAIKANVGSDILTKSRVKSGGKSIPT